MFALADELHENPFTTEDDLLTAKPGLAAQPGIIVWSFDKIIKLKFHTKPLATKNFTCYNILDSDNDVIVLVAICSIGTLLVIVGAIAFFVIRKKGKSKNTNSPQHSGDEYSHL